MNGMTTLLLAGLGVAWMVTQRAAAQRRAAATLIDMPLTAEEAAWIEQGAPQPGATPAVTAIVGAELPMGAQGPMAYPVLQGFGRTGPMWRGQGRVPCAVRG